MSKSKKNFLESLNRTQAFLHFDDGTSFSGTINLEKSDPLLIKGIWGESAFTTAMTGYQETITDPSFLGQHIIFSSPHIGNYPPNKKVNQSSKSHATSIIARDFFPNSFLENLDTPLFTCDDTRALVRFITQKKGSHISVITPNEVAPSKESFEKAPVKCNQLDLVGEQEVETIVPGDSPIVLVNYGCKSAIIKNLKKLGFPLVTVGYNTTAKQIKSLNPRLIFLSNGPGDPRHYTFQIEQVKEMLSFEIPVRGICLGHQLITLALGASIIKLPFGQRGVNHPVIEHETGKILITSQNHGYASNKEELTQKLKNNILKREIFISY
ncbi:carbamoyl phosphate synthase small subunit, partial [Bacteriovoracales bacterium]|nr:carbamoyl phosphate synthase small subunit [Bacteriovoracales bacterium]